MTTYRVELQMPYGTLVDVYEGSSLSIAAARKCAYLKAGKGKAFVPCFINGKEVPPSRLPAAHLKGKK